MQIELDVQFSERPRLRDKFTDVNLLEEYPVIAHHKPAVKLSINSFKVEFENTGNKIE